VSGGKITQFNLTPYETDFEDSGANLKWNISGDNIFLFTVDVDPTSDILTIIPRLESGYDVMTLTLYDSDGGVDTQNIEVNVIPRCAGIHPPETGDWNITSNTSCANTNITLSGNSNLNVFGNVTLTFDNVTLILDNGTLTAYDEGNANSVVSVLDSIVDSIIDWIT